MVQHLGFPPEKRSKNLSKQLLLFEYDHDILSPMKKQVFFTDKTNSFNTLEKPLAEICAYLHIDK